MFVVLTADRMDCGHSASPLQLADVGSSGVVHLSSSLVPVSQSSDSACGSDAAPWLISAHPGQRVRVTLLDFDVAVQPSTSLNDTATLVCSSTTWGQTVYAIISDAAGSADNVTVCGGWTSAGAEVQTSARSRVVYETVGYVVEIRTPVIGRQQAVARQRRTGFILRVSGKQGCVCWERGPRRSREVFVALCVDMSKTVRDMTKVTD